MPLPYHISMSLNAAKSLAEMPPEQRGEIDRQLSQIAELAAVDHASATWRDSMPLRLVVGPVAVRYVVSDENRIITVTELEPSSAVG